MIDAQQFLIFLCKHKDANGKLKPIYLADTIKEEIQIIEEAIKYSQRWVGLTNEEIENFVAYLYPLPEKPVRERLRVLLETLKERNT